MSTFSHPFPSITIPPRPAPLTGQWTAFIAEYSPTAQDGTWTATNAVPVTYANGAMQLPAAVLLPVERTWIRVRFIDANGVLSLASASVFSPRAAGAYYTTPDMLRAELHVDAATLPNADAYALIDDAQDLVDAELGRRPIDPLTGRAVTPALIAPWQRDKLARATAKLAALLYLKPDLAGEQRWKTVRGPDFEFSGRDGSLWGSLIVSLIDGTRLRVTRGAYSVRTPPAGPTRDVIVVRTFQS